MIRSPLFKIPSLIFLSLLMLFNSIPALAGTPAESRSSIKGGWTRYLEEKDCSVDSTASNGVSNNKVYIVGDSYSIGIDSTLTKDLKDAGYEVAGKNEDNAGQVLKAGDSGVSAMQALDKDKEKIAASGSMTVFLGTNGGNEDIPKFMDKLKTVNPTIKVYWMTIGYISQNAPDSYLQSQNKLLKDVATKYGITVIDWYAEFSKDRSGLSAGVHPTDKGYRVLSKLFVDTMGKYTSPTPTTEETSGGGDESNEKKAWLFLTSSSGMSLQPAQAAGVMGNLNQESSGFKPATVEAGGGGGFGIAQWTGPRRIAIETEASKLGKDINDFQFQLDWLKKTAERDYADMMKKLRATQDPQEATYIWHGPTTESTGTIPKYDFPGYESSGDNAAGIAERVADAKRFLKKYAGITGSDNACTCPDPAASTSTAPANLPPESEFIKKFGENKSVAWAEVGGKPTVYGKAQTMKAWSTSKVLVTAAYLSLKRTAGDQDGNITTALRDSNNEAIIAVYNAGGGDATMPDAMTKILRSIGDKDTNIATQMGEGSATKEGQTMWSMANQVNFMSALSKGTVVDKDSSKYIISKMKPSQKWGLGTIGASAYKPGWGPSGSETRQMGIVKGSNGKDYAVAIGQTTGKASPDEEGNSELAKWLQENVLGKEAGDCGSISGDLMGTIRSYAWEDGRDGHEAKPAYTKATAEAKAKGEYVGGCIETQLWGEDCGAFVTRAMRNSGASKEYNFAPKGGPTSTQQDFMDKHPEKYEKLGVDVSTDKLKMGDIAVNPQHTYIYIGKESNWEGNTAAASECGKMPRATTEAGIGGGFSWYRVK